MRNRLLFAIPLTIILGGLLLLHVYWALGGRWGSASTVPTVNGRRSFDPSPLAIWVVCGLLGLAVIIVMGKSGWIAPGPLPVLFDAGVWGLGIVFGLRAIGNLRTFDFFRTVKGTPFADWNTWFYSPLCLLLALLAAGLVWLPRGNVSALAGNGESIGYQLQYRSCGTIPRIT
jgi:hypothetical protein